MVNKKQTGDGESEQKKIVMEDQQQKPQVPAATCGRIVHYFPNGDVHCQSNNANVLPAIVIQKFGLNELSLNLSVFCMNRDSSNVLRFSVPHKSVVEDIVEDAYWDWPSRV